MSLQCRKMARLPRTRMPHPLCALPRPLLLLQLNRGQPIMRADAGVLLSQARYASREALYGQRHGGHAWSSGEAHECCLTLLRQAVHCSWSSMAKGDARASEASRTLAWRRRLCVS